MKKGIVFLCFFLIIFCTYAQNHTISGYIKEDASGESLFGTNVYIKETLKGSTTNQYGFYSITIPDGKYTLVFSYLSFITQEFPIELNQDIRKNVSLKSASIETQEVVISAKRDDKNVQSVEMGRDKIEVDKIKTLPANTLHSPSGRFFRSR